MKGNKIKCVCLSNCLYYIFCVLFVKARSTITNLSLITLHFPLCGCSLTNTYAHRLTPKYSIWEPPSIQPNNHTTKRIFYLNYLVGCFWLNRSLCAPFYIFLTVSSLQMGLSTLNYCFVPFFTFYESGGLTQPLTLFTDLPLLLRLR